MDMCPDDKSLEMKDLVGLPFPSDASTGGVSSTERVVPSKREAPSFSQLWLFPPMMSLSTDFYKYWALLHSIERQGLNPIQVLIVDYETTRTLQISYNEVFSPSAQLKQHFFLNHAARNIFLSRTLTRKEHLDHRSFTEDSLATILWHLKMGRFIGWIMYVNS